MMGEIPVTLIVGCIRGVKVPDTTRRSDRCSLTVRHTCDTTLIIIISFYFCLTFEELLPLKQNKYRVGVKDLNGNHISSTSCLEIVDCIE